jgi:hypothetical protein
VGLVPWRRPAVALLLRGTPGAQLDASPLQPGPSLSVNAPERAFGVVEVSLYISGRKDELGRSGTCVPEYALGG